MPPGSRRMSFIIAVSLFVTVVLLYWSRQTFLVYGPENRKKEDLKSKPVETKPLKEEVEDPVWDNDRLDIAKYLAANITITNKVAAIIETRPLHNLVPLLLHFSSVLGPEWPIVLFTSLPALPKSAPLQRALDAGNIGVIGLPTNARDFKSHQSLSVFLTQPWFWEQLAPAQRVLMFQTDSIVCSNAPQTVDEFLKWDFVGAPITKGWGLGYNGGLSLRNREMVLEIIGNWNFKKELDEANKVLPDGGELALHIEYEDQWLFKKMSELPQKPDGSPGALLPNEDESKIFSVETVFYERPLGYHQIHKFQPQHLDWVEKWCPEYKLAVTDIMPVNHDE